MKRWEMIKTALLTALIISAAVLTSKIWFSEELWSSGGYNSFYISEASFLSKLSSFFFKGGWGNSLKFNQIFYPKQIVVNTGGKMQLLPPGSEEYNYFYGAAGEMLEKFFNKINIEEITDEELLRAYKAPSIYYDFYTPISFDMLAEYYKADSGAESELDEIKHILVSLRRSSTGGLAVYVRNNEKNKSYRLNVDYPSEEISSEAEKAVRSLKDGQKFYSYAYENNFDKRLDGTDDKLLLDSYLILSINEGSLKSISGKKVYEPGNISQISNILNYFSMSLGSSRPYTDSSQAMNFVENFAAVKIYPSGFLQYTSADDSKGIELEADSGREYSLIKAAGDFIAGFYNEMGMDSKSIVFNDISYDPQKDEYTLSFDCLYNGVKIAFGNSSGIENSTVVKIHKGIITSFSQQLLTYEETEDSEYIPPAITALDEFYSVFDVEGNKELVIRDLYNVYFVGEDGVSVKWAVALSDGQIIYI